MSALNERALLRRVFDAAIAAAQPALSVPPALPAAPQSRLIVIGASTCPPSRAAGWQPPVTRRAW